MNKKMLYALILMGLTVLVLIFNRQDATVDLIFDELKAMSSLIYLGFTTIGVVIGVLLK
jgi:uncharacterized integral membrane protein